ncbi:MAG: thiamine-phosphate kinase [Gammaproteobacteria bacterium]|nr:thiamine-phosphate kinase [Gammaproteobacteria bacterium]MBU1723219.1 thiamine-phosphate kinase [Gammaproteobacteria bacterium]MBU2007244.1 thiamine-phosphate kinase [Gammaproteobacteria bacterium]
MSEFDLIRDYFHWQNPPDSVRVSVGDDAAVLSMPAGRELVVSVDTFNAGIHFPRATPPHAIGYKALAVNLSDLAAMGAEPAWFTLAISLPEADRAWISEFARGMRELAQQHGIFLIGGDTTRGPLSITVQVMGFVRPGRALLRSNAKQGDLICVSGTLGDAAAGLAVVQQGLELSVDAAEYCVQRLNYPTPRNALTDILGEHANACMDISDGLLADLGHILKASQLGAKLEHARLPFSAALLQLPLEQRLEFALTGGDDYEVLFTLPPARFETVKNAAAERGVLFTNIGKVNENIGDLQLDHGLSAKKQGYDHFSAN